MSNNINKIDQGDKPRIIEEILKFYKNGWNDYSIHMLREHLEDIKTPLSNKTKESLSKEQIVNILLSEDKTELSNKSYYELTRELYDYQTKVY